MKARKPLHRSGRPSPKVRPERSGRLHAELILVGRDLLRGRVAEGNARQLAGLLSARGALVHRITVVDDNERAIGNAVREALERNPHLVITTGGLGPAPDDRTLAAVSDTVGRPLTLNLEARTMVESAYRRLHEAKVVDRAGLNLAREKMCRIPVGSVPLPNERGVAPGVICRLPGGAAVVCVPGDPGESLDVLEAALRRLADLAPHGRTVLREIESPTADESELPPLLQRLAAEFPHVWISSRPASGEHRGSKAVVTLEASAATGEEADAAVDAAVRRLLALAAGSK